MSTIKDEIRAAEAASEAARHQLGVTLATLQARLNPRALANAAVEELKVTGEDLARNGLAAAKRNAGPIAGLAATIGLVLARHQVGGLISHLTGEDETGPETKSLKNKRAPSDRGKKS